jgi:hypothetical protein
MLSMKYSLVPSPGAEGAAQHTDFPKPVAIKIASSIFLVMDQI